MEVLTLERTPECREDRKQPLAESWPALALSCSGLASLSESLPFLDFLYLGTCHIALKWQRTLNLLGGVEPGFDKYFKMKSWGLPGLTWPLSPQTPHALQRQPWRGICELLSCCET